MDFVSYIVELIECLSPSPVAQAFLAGCIGFILTVAGGIPALFSSRANGYGDFLSIGLGFSAGVMIAASFTSLLIPSAEVGGVIPAVVGFLTGGIAVYTMDRLLPHEHLVKGFEGPEKLRRKLRAAWLLAMAIVIHNIPEGAAVGAAVVESLRRGVLLAIAIGIQNIPEGLAVALPLIAIDRRVGRAMAITFFSGFIEPIAALFTASLVTVLSGLLPYMLSFAAGAMIYVVSHEIIPETHSEKREIKATIALLTGLVTMFALDTYYG